MIVVVEADLAPRCLEQRWQTYIIIANCSILHSLLGSSLLIKALMAT